MSDQPNIKQIIFRELHDSPYAGHPRYEKLITTLKKDFYWPNMKREEVEYVTKYLECQQVKVVHQHLVEILKLIPIP